MLFLIGVKIVIAVMAVKVSCDCGIATGNTNPSEILEDGINAEIFPWRVGIYRESGRFFILVCPGNLISPNVVVTAASCLSDTQDDVDITKFHMLVGSDPQSNIRLLNLKSYKIQTFYRTAGYPALPGRPSGDIAWLILQKSVNVTSSQGPACIDLENRHDGEEIPVGLVGQIMYLPTPDIVPLRLRKMKIIPFTHTSCLAAFPNESRRNSSLNPSCAQLSTEIEAIHIVVGGGFYTQRSSRWYISAIMTDVLYIAGDEGTFILALFVNIERYADDAERFGITRTCGRAAAPVYPLITHGFETKLGWYPWHVAVYQKNSTGFHDQMCAGSLISTKVVVSAAHCFYDEVRRRKQAASGFAIAAGKLYRLYDWPEEFVQKSAVETIHLPSRYHGVAGNYAEDIAWLILKHPFFNSAFVMPICIDFHNLYQRKDLQTGQLGKVVGWGRTAAGVLSNKLQEVHVPSIPYDRCILALPQDFVPFLTFDKFCAGYLNGTGVCDGDSGGGLAFRHDGIWYLRGIVSLGPISDPGTCPHSYTAFTDIGHFIDEHQRIVNISTHGSN